jgi:hypothetical protein
METHEQLRFDFLYEQHLTNLTLDGQFISNMVDLTQQESLISIKPKVTLWDLKVSV